jgi:signal transduction histidine kinase
VIGDSDRLQQAAHNLMQNAIQNQFTGKIVVFFGFDMDQSQLVLIVKDEG